MRIRLNYGWPQRSHSVFDLTAETVPTTSSQTMSKDSFECLETWSITIELPDMQLQRVLLLRKNFSERRFDAACKVRNFLRGLYHDKS